jgi:hypothetical protein
MRVLFCSEAVGELNGLPPAERAAMLSAVEKLVAIGDHLPYPHSSAVKHTKLRELRPRGGRSPWRAFYRRFEGWLLIGAIGPEADADPKGFRRAVETAEKRLTAVTAGERVDD